MTRRQCLKCPWKVRTNPRDIPGGYSVVKHRALTSTIKEGVHSIGRELRLMACHETDEEPCVGWLMNQLGPGNNIGLRLAAARGRIDTDVKLVGRQHATLTDTLPKCEACLGTGLIIRSSLCPACDGTGKAFTDGGSDDD